ncbi:DUF1559 domain-containing protein [Planctomycetota bacterium]
MNREEQIAGGPGGPGFTIVELLVVIAIIMLLIALLFPIISSARDRGRQIQCVANLRQFHLAFNMYCNDNKGWFPMGTAIGNTPDGWIFSTWVAYDAANNVLSGGASPAQVRQGVLWRYIEDYRVYLCPGDMNKRKRGFSYSMNVAYAEKNISTAQAHLANVVLMVEEHHPDDGCFWYKNSGAVRSRDCLSFDRHCTASCMLFGDGHVLGLPYVRLDTTVELSDVGEFPGEPGPPWMR